MVEFTLIAPFLLLLVFGLIDFGRLAYDNSFVNNAAREGARVATPAQESGVSAASVQATVHDAVARTVGGGISVDSTVRDLSLLLPVGGSFPRTCPTPRPSPNDAVIYITPYTAIPGGRGDVTVQVCFYFAPFTPLVAKWFPSTFVTASSVTMKTEY